MKVEIKDEELRLASNYSIKMRNCNKVSNFICISILLFFIPSILIDIYLPKLACCSNSLIWSVLIIQIFNECRYFYFRRKIKRIFYGN